MSNGLESEDYAGVWPWPSIRKTYEVLVEKLQTVDRRVQVAVVDWWIGQLYLVRAEIEAGKFGPRRRRARKQ